MFYSGFFAQAAGNCASDLNATGNYLVFRNVTGANFTLTATAVNFYQNAPVNGLAIVSSTCQVDVIPPFFQGAPVGPNIMCPLTPIQLANAPWACDDYANSSEPIRKKGCSLTALAMALRSAGVCTISGTSVFLDPGSLNQYMINNNLFSRDPDPTKNNNVMWDETARSISGGILKLRFTPFSLTTTSGLDGMLCAGFPPIVQVQNGGHFVLVTGKKGNTYNIVDPGHRLNTDLQAYGNTFNAIRGFIADPPGDISGLDVNVGSAAELLVMDSSGRRTGFDNSSGTTLEEIPQAIHFVDALADDETGAPPNGASHSVDIFQPASGTYRVILAGLNPKS